MLAELNEKFGIDGALTFSAQPSGLVLANIETDLCTGSMYLLGAHIAEFQPRSQCHPVLFMSQEAVYEVGKAIRGGVPICFPWFGPHATDAQAPAHGLVRTQLWEVASTALEDEAIVIVLKLPIENYDLRFRVVFGRTLSMELSAGNRTDVDQLCEVALHSYFQVGDIHEVRIEGLEQTPYRDKLTGRIESAALSPLQFDGECDRVYMGQVPHIKLIDGRWSRTIVVTPRESNSTVVWNPWIEKSKRLADFGDQEYLQMCCIETANVAPNPMRIAAHSQQSVGVTISIE